MNDNKLTELFNKHDSLKNILTKYKPLLKYYRFSRGKHKSKMMLQIENQEVDIIDFPNIESNGQLIEEVQNLGIMIIFKNCKVNFDYTVPKFSKLFIKTYTHGYYALFKSCELFSIKDSVLQCDNKKVNTLDSTMDIYAFSSTIKGFVGTKLNVFGINNTISDCHAEQIYLSKYIFLDRIYSDKTATKFYDIVSEPNSIYTLNNCSTNVLQTANEKELGNFFMKVNNCNIREFKVGSEGLVIVNKNSNVTIKDRQGDYRFIRGEIRESSPNEYNQELLSNGLKQIDYNKFYNKDMIKVSKKHKIVLNNFYELVHISNDMGFVFKNSDEVKNAINRGSFKIDKKDDETILTIYINENLFTIVCKFDFLVSNHIKYFIEY